MLVALLPFSGLRKVQVRTPIGIHVNNSDTAPGCLKDMLHARIEILAHVIDKVEASKMCNIRKSNLRSCLNGA